MMTEVQCPKCHAKLRSANDLTGKSVRCKKCETRFRAVGEASPGESVGDMQALRVMEITLPRVQTAKPVTKVAVKRIINQDDDSLMELDPLKKPTAKATAKAAPIPLPPPAQVANPLSFDEPAEKPKKKKKTREEDDETVNNGFPQSVATLPDAGSSAFSFDDPPEPPKKKKKRASDEEDEDEIRTKKKKKRASDEEDEDEDVDRPRNKKGKRNYDDDNDGHEKPKYGNKSNKTGSSRMLFLGIGILVVLLGGAGIAALLLIGKKDKAKTTPSTNPVSVAQVLAKGAGAKPTETKPAGTETTKPAVTEPTKTTEPSPKGISKEPKPPLVVKSGIPKAPAAVLNKVAKTEFKITCDYSPESIKAFCTSKEAGTLKIFLVRNTFGGFNGFGAEDTIYRFEGGSGADAGSVKVKGEGCVWPRPFEASPDGKQILIEAPAGKLTLYDFEEKKFLLEGVDPHNGMAMREGPMKSCGWLTDGKFFVVDKNSSIDIWSAAEKKVLTVGLGLNNPKTEDTAKIIATAVGSSGKYVVSTLDNQSMVTSNGAPAIQKPIQYAANGAIPLGIAGDVTGEKVAYLYQSGIDQYELAVGDTKTAPTKTIQLPADCGKALEVSWQAQDTIVVSIEGGQAALLIDTEEMIVVGYLKCPTAKGQVFAKGMFPLIWWAIPDSMDPKKTVIASAKLDFDDYSKMRTDTKLSRNIPYLVPREDDLAK